MDRSASALPITEKELSGHTTAAVSLITKVAYKPRVKKPQAPASGGFVSTLDLSTYQEAEEVSVLGAALAMNPEVPLLHDKINHVMRTVWQGVRIGRQLAHRYGEASNLEVLRQRQSSGLFSDLEKTEFREKNTTAAAVAIFVTAYHVIWELTRSGLGDSKVEYDGVPETNLQNSTDAVTCMLFYYGTCLKQPDKIQTPDDFLRMTHLFFRSVMDEVQKRMDSLQYTEPFTSRCYKLENSEFAVTGFHAEVGAGLAVVEFKRIYAKDIVGNRDAKHNARRIVQRILCYDFKRKRNPFLEIGAISKVRLGWGKPGTGKTMLIKHIATMFAEWCEQLGYPFLFAELPKTVISTFQGGSAINAMDWFRLSRDPNKIIYMPMDDAETVLEARTRHGVSAGVREFISVALTEWEGASTIEHGNVLYDVMTNLPDQIDPAVLSRMVSRFEIPGAMNAVDIRDQDHLWWRKIDKSVPGFVNMADSDGHKYLAAQEALTSLSASKDRREEPKDTRLKAAFRRVRNRFEINDHAFFAHFYAAVQEDFPFTSRDMRNIQSAVDNRLTDFELPQEWFDHPDQFFHLDDYDLKKAMLTELMRGNMNGVSFAQLRLQEAVGYLDEMVAMTDAAREREIDELVQRSIRSREAEARLKGMELAGKFEYLALEEGHGSAPEKVS